MRRSGCGVKKIRLTGGEPLVRRGIVELCRQLRAIPGLQELCLTTNGSLLRSLAAPLREAGVDRLNISLDTLQPERFAEMTRLGQLSDVLEGICGGGGCRLSGPEIRHRSHRRFQRRRDSRFCEPDPGPSLGDPVHRADAHGALRRMGQILLPAGRHHFGADTGFTADRQPTAWPGGTGCPAHWAPWA